MNNDSNTSELVRLLAEQQGLGQALALFPDAVHAAAGRGLKPLGALPEACTPLTAPAAVFDPARFGPKK